jgi:hypothetical protein
MGDGGFEEGFERIVGRTGVSACKREIQEY